jgi:RHS repeat-associated protein
LKKAEPGALSKAHAVTTAGANAYCYDPNGNMVRRNIGLKTYNLAYDAENRLTQVSGAAAATFNYDGDGQRVLGLEGGTTTVYIGNYFEWKGSTSTMVRYYYAGAERVAMRTGTADPLWLVGDHLGSTSVVANYDGTIYINGTTPARQGYKAWGEQRFPNPLNGSPLPTTFRYTGQREGSFGLYFYGARWYDSYLNRFVQADDLIPEPKNAQAWDRYAYTLNNPVRYTDPSGNCTGDPRNPKNRDHPCWEKLQRIREKYGDFIDVDSDFSLGQLDYMLRALDAAASAFGGISKFAAATGSFSIILGGDRGAPTGIFGQVTLYGSDFGNYLKPSYILYRILHEIGHIFDFHGAGLNSYYYKSMEFVDNLNTVPCQPGLLGCVTDNPGGVYSLFGPSGGNWKPSPAPPFVDGNRGRYGERSSVDDFADSFAIYVLHANGVNDYDISSERQSILGQYFAIPY